MPSFNLHLYHYWQMSTESPPLPTLIPTPNKSKFPWFSYSTLHIQCYILPNFYDEKPLFPFQHFEATIPSVSPQTLTPPPAPPPSHSTPLYHYRGCNISPSNSALPPSKDHPGTQSTLQGEPAIHLHFFHFIPQAIPRLQTPNLWTSLLMHELQQYH